MVHVLFYIILILSYMNTGFMLFDGLRALITGDYIRPKTGNYAGQLGPWAKIVQRMGIDPESLLMKCIFIAFGLAGLFITTVFAMQHNWGWSALLIYNICGLWYLVFGTLSSLLQIVLLLILKL